MGMATKSQGAISDFKDAFDVMDGFDEEEQLSDDKHHQNA
jgi:hypothetical protein